MLRNKSSTLFLKNFSRCSFPYTRQFCSRDLLGERPNVTTGIGNLRNSLEEKMKVVQQQRQQQLVRAQKTSIYRVPSKLRSIDPRAYEPHFISVGPYHHGSPKLKEFEELKWDALNKVVGLGLRPYRDELDRLLSCLDAIEPQARESYSDDVGLSRDEFVKMMLLDGCFIVELLSELKQTGFISSSLFPKRWMLPVVRRDLIALENQLPLVVLKKIFEEIIQSNSNSNSNYSEKTSLESLALTFFDPLMPSKKHLLRKKIAYITSSPKKFHHLLDVYHSSITFGKEMPRDTEPHMYRPLTELKKAGIKVRNLEHTHLLDLRFEGGVLRMPSLVMDNHTGCFLKNIVAYEQCHQECKPDVTTYLFLLDKLVNSAEDVAVLNYEGVIQHSLGNNNQVSKLISNLCLDVEYDGKESYLYKLISDINSYSGNWLVMLRSRLKQDYFGNMWVSISTLAALLLLYLTLLQATCDAININAQKKGIHETQKKGIHELKGLWFSLNSFLLDPVEWFEAIFESYNAREIQENESTFDYPTDQAA